MIVTDDGRGFDYAGARSVAGSHLGILGMRERASLLDGHCDVLSAPGHGTVVEATVPLHRAPGNRAARTTGNRTFTPIAR